MRLNRVPDEVLENTTENLLTFLCFEFVKEFLLVLEYVSVDFTGDDLWVFGYFEVKDVG